MSLRCFAEGNAGTPLTYIAPPSLPCNSLCNPIGGKDAPNLEGYVAFLFRTTEAGCEYAVQAQNLADLNATAFVAINDER